MDKWEGGGCGLASFMDMKFKWPNDFVLPQFHVPLTHLSSTSSSCSLEEERIHLKDGLTNPSLVDDDLAMNNFVTHHRLQSHSATLNVHIYTYSSQPALYLPAKSQWGLLKGESRPTAK